MTIAPSKDRGQGQAAVRLVGFTGHRLRPYRLQGLQGMASATPLQPLCNPRVLPAERSKPTRCAYAPVGR